MRTGHPLNAARRRARKEQLARRHGRRCTYCHRPFATLREATLDHVVPHSLFRTWSVVHLVLACSPCNHAKADRLPLSIALLLVWSQGPDQRDDRRHTSRHAPGATGRPVFTEPDRPTVHPVKEVEEVAVHPVFTAPGDVFTPTTHRTPGLDSGSGKPPVGSGEHQVGVGGIHPASTPGHLAFWLLLTRLAHTRQSTAAPRERCGERREQSPPGQEIHRRSARRAVRVGRLEHQRRTPRLNTCEQPTDRGVSA
ncbi:HNH endonuclease [Streptomyces atroolivaceus]|uniref:HNH endonuclease n=1 Tax=Streptomyces atroolivaceus TaxID=66869 RepID=UPI003414CF3C